MKKLLYLAGVALVATLLLGACSSDDDDNQQNHNGSTLTEGTDVRPSWVVSSDASLQDDCLMQT